jgi:hypothetical protein
MNEAHEVARNSIDNSRLISHCFTRKPQLNPQKFRRDFLTLPGLIVDLVQESAGSDRLRLEPGFFGI